MPKRLIFLILVFFTLQSNLISQALFPIIDSTCRFGFINKTGEVVVKPIYDCVFDFNEGLAPVLINEKWGYIDTNGAMHIENIYKKALNFSDGLALVIKDSLVGYINKDGKTVIPFMYRDGFSFSEGLAAVAFVKRGWAYIDENNKWNKRLNKKINFGNYDYEYGLIPPFFESSLIYYDDGYSYGRVFYDRKGKKYKFSKDVGLFYDGLADFNENNRYGFITIKDKVVIPAKYYRVSNFNNGLAWVADSLINSNFNLLLIDRNDSIYKSINFGKTQPLFIINNENNICYINLKNSDSIAYVNSMGDILFVKETRYDFKNKDLYKSYSFCRRLNNNLRNLWLSPWHDGLIPIKRNGVLKYVDIKGNVIWEGKIPLKDK